MKQDRNGRLSITSGSAKLLKVVLHRGRVLPINNQPHVWNVESHTEGARTNDSIYRRAALPNKSLCQLLPLPRGRELGVIKWGVQSLISKKCLQCLANFSSRHEDHDPSLRWEGGFGT